MNLTFLNKAIYAVNSYCSKGDIRTFYSVFMISFYSVFMRYL